MNARRQTMGRQSPGFGTANLARQMARSEESSSESLGHAIAKALHSNLNYPCIESVLFEIENRDTPTGSGRNRGKAMHHGLCAHSVFAANSRRIAVVFAARS